MLPKRKRYPAGGTSWVGTRKGTADLKRVPRTLNVSLVPHLGDPDAITSNPRFARPGKAGTDIDLTTMKDLQGYRLKSKSSAIDKGKSIKTAEDPRDFFGSPIKGRRVNLGAVE